MNEQELKEKVHYIAVTGIIRKDGKYLICQRSPDSKLFPSKWCVPGGKLEQKDFMIKKKDTSEHWLSVFECTLSREIREEVGLDIHKITYVSNLAFLRPNGFSTIVVSLSAEYASGQIALSSELVDYAWVTCLEAKKYDLIENIYEQIAQVEEKFSSHKLRN